MDCSSLWAVWAAKAIPPAIKSTATAPLMMAAADLRSGGPSSRSRVDHIR
jgi:hypothetical protein